MRQKTAKKTAKPEAALLCILAGFLCVLTGALSGCASETAETSSEQAVESSAETEDNAQNSTSGSEMVSETGMYFDTVIQIQLYEEDADAIDGCFELAQHYEDLLSNTVEGSDIYNINEADGAYVTVDADTLEILQTVLDYCEESGGIFDITVGEVADLWDFANNDGDIPADADIAEAAEKIDYTAVQIDGDQVALTSGAKIDLGAIAKGFIADKMKEYLTEQGVESGIINLGGNVLLIGEKTGGEAYKVGVEKPFDSSDIMGYFEIRDQSVVTSGVYQRYFEVNGTIYHHLLDVQTGYPMQNGLYSVTILSDDSMTGDALSTICFLEGLEDGMARIESLDGIEAVFVTEDYEVYTTSGIGESVTFVQTQ